MNIVRIHNHYLWHEQTGTRNDERTLSTSYKSINGKLGLACMEMFNGKKSITIYLLTFAYASRLLM